MRIVLHALLLTILVLTAWCSFSQPGPPQPSQPAGEPAGELVAWAAAAVIVVGAGVVYWRWRRHGDETQAIALSHGLAYTRTLASDGREPFAQVPTVSRGVLLHNVLEGRWRDLDVAVFDMRPHRNAGSWTYALLPLPGGWPDLVVSTAYRGKSASNRARLALLSTWEPLVLSAASGVSVTVMTDALEAAARVIGPETARIVAGASHLRIEIHSEHLLYTEMEKVEAAAVPAFLDRVAGVVDALVVDRPSRDSTTACARPAPHVGEGPVRQSDQAPE